MSNEERTWWRDPTLSWRRRYYGDRLATTDIDFVEYADGRIAAIMEMKKGRPRDIQSEDQRKNGSDSTSIIKLIGRKLEVPVLVGFYDLALHRCWFAARALTLETASLLPPRCLPMDVRRFRIFSEQEWIEFEYHLRLRTPPRISLEKRKTPKIEELETNWEELKTWLAAGGLEQPIGQERPTLEQWLNGG